jgi:transposase
VHYQNAWLWAKHGWMPVPVVRTPSGGRLVTEPEPPLVIRLEDDRRHVRLPRLGAIKTHESTRKLRRRIADGRARILSATVRAEAGRWYVSFTVEVQRAIRAPARPDAVVGVDLGIKTLAVFSDTRPPAQNPRHYEAARRELARLSRAVSRRQGPDRRTGQRPSNRWRRANAARNRVHHRVTNLRRKLRLSERTYTCATCGLVIDRDENAAINLASLVKRVVAGSGPETQNGRGADRETRPVRAGGCEASTPHRVVPARVRRGPSPSNARITEIH